MKATDPFKTFHHKPQKSQVADKGRSTLNTITQGYTSNNSNPFTSSQASNKKHQANKSITGKIPTSHTPNPFQMQINLKALMPDSSK